MKQFAVLMVKSLVFHFQRMLTTFNGDGEYFDDFPAKEKIRRDSMLSGISIGTNLRIRCENGDVTQR